MQLTRITIENLRAIERFDLDLTEVGGWPRGRLVLLGANGSGKTTILDAVAHAFQILGAGNTREGQYEFGARSLDAGDVRIGSPGVEGAEETPRRATIRLEAYIPEPHRERRDLPRGGSMTFTIGPFPGLSIGSWPLRPSVEMEDEFRSAVLSSLQSARPPCVLLPSNRGALESDENEDPRLRDVTDFNPRWGCLAKGRARFAPLAARLAYAHLGGEHVDPQGKVRRMWKALERYVPELPRPTGVKGLQLWFRNGDGSEVPLSALSDGERAILLLFGEIALRAPEHGLVMIDDVEQYLHPRWQLAALEGLPALASTAQFIFATQSPYVAACAPDDVVEVGDWKRHGE